MNNNVCAQVAGITFSFVCQIRVINTKRQIEANCWVKSVDMVKTFRIGLYPILIDDALSGLISRGFVDFCWGGFGI
jgi:hypothetical protein